MGRTLSVFILLALVAGCSLPRVVILDDPLDAREHNDLGVAYEARGEYELALREYSEAAHLDARWSRPLINRGNVHARREEWSRAAEDYRAALRRSPDHPEAMNNLAWALLQTKDLDGALQWGEKAVAAAPREPAYLDTLARIHLARREYGAARRLLGRAFDQNPTGALRTELQAQKALLENLAPPP